MNAQDARKKWPYLFKPEYGIRRELAHELANGLDIVEVGASGQPVRSEGKHTAVEDLKSFDVKSVSKPFALVILGIDIEGGQAAVNAAKQLAREAQIVIVEVSRNYPRGVEQMDQVLGAANGKELFRKDLDIDGTPQGERLIVSRGEAPRKRTTTYATKPARARSSAKK